MTTEPEDKPIDWRELKARFEAEDRENEVQAWLVLAAVVATVISCLWY